MGILSARSQAVFPMGFYGSMEKARVPEKYLFLLS